MLDELLIAFNTFLSSWDGVRFFMHSRSGSSQNLKEYRVVLAIPSALHHCACTEYVRGLAKLPLPLCVLQQNS